MRTTLNAMKDSVMGKVRATPRSIRNSGWKRIPTLSSFNMSEAWLNELLLKYGYNKKDRKFYYEHNKYKKMNRYMEHQIIRAEKALKNPPLFWTIAKYTVIKSVTFRLSAYIKIFPRWYYEESLELTSVRLKSIAKKINTFNDDLILNRIYIPKNPDLPTKGDNVRPLGVPSSEWRVISHMWTNWLTMYLRHMVEDFNHAYLPGKGTNTAWRYLINHILDKENIWEFDLKGFFNNVKINEVTEILINKGVPKQIVYFIESVNRVSPEIPDEELMDESVAKDRKNIATKLKQGIIDPTLSIFTELETFRNTHGEELLQILVAEDGYDNEYEWAQAQWAALDHYSPQGMGDAFKGLPQGLNWSPILSILTLKKRKDNLMKYEDLLMYADDGLIGSNVDIEWNNPEDWEDIHPEKSKYLKKDGIWKVDGFKFLGLYYNVKEGTISGRTRKGSILSIPENSWNLFEEISKLTPLHATDKITSSDLGMIENKTAIWHLANSTLFNLTISNLYNGVWNGRVNPEKEYKIHKDSYLGRVLSKERTKLSSSIAVHVIANLIKNSIKKS